ncbi:MAG: O-antigen ligase family protein [Oceanicaulis sp.]
MLAGVAIWPLGGARPVFWAGVGALLCLILLIDTLSGRRPARLEAPSLKIAAVIVYGLITYGVLQAAPIAPAGLAHPAFETFALARDEPPPTFAPISANPTASLQAALLGTVVALFALAGRLAGRQRGSAYLALDIVLGSITLAALTSIILAPFGNPFPWLAERWTYQDRPAGPFVNPNMFGYLCASGVVIAAALGTRLAGERLGSGAGLRADLIDGVTALAGRAGVYLVSLLICAHAMLATGSRNAIFALAAAALASLVWGALASRGRGTLPLLGGALALTLIVLFSPANGLLAERVMWAAVDERHEIYQDIVTAIRANPLLGHGLGAFADAFPVYQTAFRPGGARVLYAHSFWLGLAFDLGLAALALAISALLLWLFHFGRQALRRNSVRDTLALGLLVLTAVFGLADDPFQTPGAVFVVAFSLGVCSASRSGWRAGPPSQAPAPRN